MGMKCGLLHYLLLHLVLNYAVAENPPNIVFIFVDDLGWNHVSWNNPEVITPNLQELVDNGVLLDQNYLLPCCTPSRAALLTGTYPYKTGRQRNPLADDQPTGLSMNYTLLPEELKILGYSTHIVGKWHLGMCDWAYTPTHRGFDTHTGYWGTMETYYNHTTVAEDAYDFRQNERIMWEASGIYSTDIYTSEAIKVIEDQHDQEQPFFLYFAHQNVHFPYKDCVPQHYIDLYPDIHLQATQSVLAMVTAMDDSVGMIVDTLKATGLYNNTIIVFSTDNGGANGIREVNYPLRGNKFELWEGGTRGPGFVHSPLLQDTPRTYDGLVHVIDWYNTLLSAAGSKALPDNDGVDQWEAIRTGQLPAPRQDFLYNLDYRNDTIYGAIRVGDHKYVMGETHSVAIGETGPWLFNLKEDPLEQNNLVLEDPVLAAELELLLLSELEDMVLADEPDGDPSGDPGNFGGVLTPGWCTAH